MAWFCLLGMRTVSFLSLRPGFPRRLWTTAEPHSPTRELGRLVADGPRARVIRAGRLGTVPNVARASQRRGTAVRAKLAPEVAATRRMAAGSLPSYSLTAHCAPIYDEYIAIASLLLLPSRR